MRIGIDCRFWGIKHAGIGRYTEELVKNLLAIDKANEYILFCRKVDFELLPEAVNSRRVVADIPHYGFAEQLKLPTVFAGQKLDLLHSPHFNVPILYRGRFVVTIHDLLWHEVKSWRATTLSLPKYAVKYLAYRGAVRNAVSWAKKIIVPTQTVKDDVVKRFGVKEDKVVVTYEGAELKNDKLKMINDKLLEKHKIEKPYLLYVGSLYPHKNVEVIVHALKLLQDKKLKLVVVSSRNVFQDRFQKFVETEGAEKQVVFAGRVSDQELAGLYQNAEAFVFPSFSEGFGLPGLEALASGAPLLASDIPVFREVYGKAPLYFDPVNPASLVSQLSKLNKDKKLKASMIAEGKKQSAKYSWSQMAKETLKVYETSTT